RRRHTRFSRDWSSDVCSSDLVERHAGPAPVVDLGAQRDIGFGIAVVIDTLLEVVGGQSLAGAPASGILPAHGLILHIHAGDRPQIGRASCRERVLMYGVVVSI